MVERPIEGLRARKKRAARQAIAAAAHRLFAERGFDAVTVAEIAAAADVSEKTVFNHFAAKEDLVFAGRDERLAQLVADIEQRPPDTPVLDVFRAATHAALDAGTSAELRTILRGSRALQQRLAVGWEDELEALAAATGDETVARTLWWTHRAILRSALAGEDRARLREMADRAYDRLAAGLGGYGAATGSAPENR
jgi:AcrR family transcriptional regulator